jgi:serine/threonine protein kinase/tetratricopeptide (TPR) repeat protein
LLEAPVAIGAVTPASMRSDLYDSESATSFGAPSSSSAGDAVTNFIPSRGDTPTSFVPPSGEAPTGPLIPPLGDAPTGFVPPLASAPRFVAGRRDAAGTFAPTAAPPNGAGATGPLEAGQAFGPRYHIIRPVGVGGMGAVYQAWDAELSVAVAIKVIRPDVMADPMAASDIERRFKRELLLARQVTHENVVRIHDLGEINGIKYITMPYVDGADLATIVKRGRLPVGRVLHIARSVVAGLVAAHKAGVVHRDLKPANIMITAEDQALIMDFGIARSTGPPTNDRIPGAQLAAGSLTTAVANVQATVFGTVVGTVEYMAPEQARGVPVDQRADIYAVGLIMYDLLVGESRSTKAMNPIAELQARMQRPPPPVRTLIRALPERVDAIISRCIEPDADKRFQTTEELAVALAALDDDGQPIPLRARFSKKLIAAAGAAVVTLVTSTWYVTRTPPLAKPHDPVSVLIADFDNRSGDPTLEGALEQTLTTALEGASFVTAYRADAAHRIAGQLRPGSTKIDEGLARLVAIREGVNVVVAGAVVPNGSGYRLSARAVDPATGREIASREIDVPNRQSLLPAVARLTPAIRKALGDSTRESDQLAAAVTFTAASLEAAHEYSLGQQFKEKAPEQAIEHYKKALQLDPNFGMAYFGMAVASVTLKRTDDAARHYQAALSLLDHMSEREKQRTLGTYYASFVRNYDQAIETFKRLVTLYPSDVVAYNNLSVTYALKLDFPGAVGAIRRAIQLSPKNMRFRLNYVIYSMYAGDFATAIGEAQRMIRDDPNYRYPYLPLALSMLVRGDATAAGDVYRQLEKLNPSTATIGEADLEMYFGRYRSALTILEHGAQADERDRNAGELALKTIAMAEAQLALGQKASAVALARKAAGLSSDESVQLPAAHALIAAGDEAAAEKIAAALDNTLQTQSRSYAQLIRAEIALQHKRYAESIDAARAAQKQHDSWIAHFLLGRAYLEAGHFAEALTDFDICLKRQGEAADLMFADSATARYIPPVYFWAARAQQGVGAQREAADNYGKFLALRGDSEVADPMVAAAKRSLRP